MGTPPAPTAPPWQHCGQGASPAADPVGCRGIHVPGHTACLAHLPAPDRATHLAGLTPGVDIDHRGTPFDQALLRELLTALHDHTTGSAVCGDAWFDGATFPDVAWFDGVTFCGDAWFDGATFRGDARFDRAVFSGFAGFGGAAFSKEARFDGAEFSAFAGFGEAAFRGDARFDGATFSGFAGFGEAVFSGDAWFESATFARNAWFGGTTFAGHALCGGTTFRGDARFDRAAFPALSAFGPLVCKGLTDLSGSVFGAPVTMEIAADEVHCVRTRWDSTATLRLRYARVDLHHAVLTAPVAVTASPTAFPVPQSPTQSLDESPLAGRGAGVRVVSVQGVDATHLVLTDLDLTDCLFSGAFHLDELRLEGRTIFASPPTGLHRHGIWPARWSRRRTLAEEHHWRALTAREPVPAAGLPPSPGSWRTGPHHPDPGPTPDPEDVAALYRQLRKAFEDGKNEPGAADFYYGECEMRRHDRTGTPGGERLLLRMYWLASGYGLRAARAMAWLVLAMTTTTVLLMGWGLPDSSPRQTATGELPARGGHVSLTMDTPAPRLSLPSGERFTGRRLDQAVQVVLNSVVFRSGDQDLTTIGTYTEMAGRFTEPVLLALVVLAMRARIKR